MLKSVRKMLMPVALVALGLMSVVSAPPTQAAATSSYLQNNLFDGTFRHQTPLNPVTLYVGLYTATATAQSCTGEVSAGSYLRVPVTSSLANWSGTQGAGTTSASSNASGTSGTISNNNAISFAAPTGNWGSITYSCLYDASSGGNEYVYFALTTPKTVNSGDAAPAYAAGALTITIGANMQDHWGLQAANDDQFAAAA